MPGRALKLCVYLAPRRVAGERKPKEVGGVPVETPIYHVSENKREPTYNYNAFFLAKTALFVVFAAFLLYHFTKNYPFSHYRRRLGEI